MRGNDLIQILFKLLRLYKKHNRNKRRGNNRKSKRGLGYKNKAHNSSELKIAELPLAKLIHVSDGDGFVAIIKDIETILRLDSIDAPELSQLHGNTAKQALTALVEGREIHVEIHGIDDYGRTLATAYVWNNFDKDWINVNEQLVLLGHAWVMQRFYDHLPYDRQRRLRNFEIAAQSKKAGLWSTKNPIPPWKWKSGYGR